MLPDIRISGHHEGTWTAYITVALPPEKQPTVLTV